ncbi:hypothetical protein CROQUDRAFT_642240 [Cronartium quercuum f. sp. fusiforme G11]|uniref:Uncharacterized protein n=1 Tax=Cronartium quercuum f. sp. fusiforme G11 TaxID=708437 RepID=A0A9P6T9G5_9BASI|nr:hypothetical protein CROQUDRAFT_642240 [Cronartium quercuum f. sp. fusiforme G11]
MCSLSLSKAKRVFQVLEREILSFFFFGRFVAPKMFLLPIILERCFKKTLKVTCSLCEFCEKETLIPTFSLLFLVLNV